LGIKKNIIEL